MLSVLICTMPNRKPKLDRLLAILEPQKTPHVEILIESDSGEMSIGAKRNKLLDRATRQYVCFVDDDDTVHPQYIAMILEAVEVNKPDCVGMCGDIQHNGNTWQFRHSITVKNWCKDKMHRIFFRTPNHLNPIKREHALRARFPEISYGEDKVYSERVRPYLTHEVFIEGSIYFYTPSGERKP